MEEVNEYNLEAYTAIDFDKIFKSDSDLSISDVCARLRKEREKIGDKDNSLVSILKTLCDVTGMMLEPNSINEPFKPVLVWGDGTRSAIASDFSERELQFYKEILPTIRVQSFAARIADVLWVCGKPKTPDYAKLAIDTYCHKDIEAGIWFEDQGNSYKRAYILARSLNDKNRISLIKERLLRQVTLYNEKTLLSISRMLVELRVPHEQDEIIAGNLVAQANKLCEVKNFQFARDYFIQAIKHYSAVKQTDKIVSIKYLIAEAWRLDAEEKFSSDKPDNMQANYNFKGAIQAYREIPNEYRARYNVEAIINDLTGKLRVSGEKLLGGMQAIKLDTTDLNLDKVIDDAKRVIAESSSKIEALYRFCSLIEPAVLDDFKAMCEEISRESFFGNLFSSSHYASDGRLIAKTEAKGLDDQGIEFDDMVKTYTDLIPYHAETIILPALQQLLLDYSIDKRFLYELNLKSEIVPQFQLNLMTEGLWYGFEYNFSTAIHLLAPLLESLVRQKLNNIGVTTIHIDSQGIEQELGLSSLLDKDEIINVFSEGTVFELKAVFTNQIGPNLRNNVAHGLLDDHSSRHLTSVYGWYIVLRTITYALIHDSVTANG